MIFGKHINRYYIKYLGWLVLGLLALIVVDWFQLIIPNMYQMVINGMNTGFVEVDGVTKVFDLAFLLDEICMPMVWIILAMVFGIDLVNIHIKEQFERLAGNGQFDELQSSFVDRIELFGYSRFEFFVS